MAENLKSELEWLCCLSEVQIHLCDLFQEW